MVAIKGQQTPAPRFELSLCRDDDGDVQIVCIVDGEQHEIGYFEEVDGCLAINSFSVDCGYFVTNEDGEMFIGVRSND